MNIIIDACLMIDIVERKCLKEEFVEWFSNFLKKGKDFTHILIGSKMKNEFLPFSDYPRNMDFYYWYTIMTAGDNSVKHSFDLRITEEDTDFDNALSQFERLSAERFTLIEKKLRDTIDDKHIIYAILSIPVQVLFSSDKRLRKVMEECMNYKEFEKIKNLRFCDGKFMYNIGNKIFKSVEELKMGYKGRDVFPETLEK